MRSPMLVLLIGTFLATPVWAKGPKHKEAGESTPALVEPGSHAPIFSEGEKKVLEEFLNMNHSHTGATIQEGKGKKLPPGLAKKAARGKPLPPGWQKKLQRGEVLDGEIYAQATRLPELILKRLPPGPVGTTILKIEDRLVRVLDATRVIVDVFERPF